MIIANKQTKGRGVFFSFIMFLVSFLYRRDHGWRNRILVFIFSRTICASDNLEGTIESQVSTATRCLSFTRFPAASEKLSRKLLLFFFFLLQKRFSFTMGWANCSMTCQSAFANDEIW